jgi:hypothetical protein
MRNVLDNVGNKTHVMRNVLDNVGDKTHVMRNVLDIIEKKLLIYRFHGYDKIHSINVQIITQRSALQFF